MDGWESILENQTQERACGSNIEYRLCKKGGVWDTPDSSRCSMCYSQSYFSCIVCDPIDGFAPVLYGEINSENRCDNNVVVSRKCLTNGKWDIVTYDGDCSM